MKQPIEEQPESSAEPGDLGASFEHLLELMQTLRGPGGCAWTSAQTHASIMHYLIEETYEVAEAVEAPGGVNLPLLCEELGDVLLNVIFHATMAAETPAAQGGFTMQDVINGLAAKLVHRNPHVFGPQTSEGEKLSAADIYDAWDQLKKAEKPERTGPFDGLPPALPALALAAKVAERAEATGVDITGADAGEQPPAFANEQELGAYLYELVASARVAGLDAERALRMYVQGLIRD
ncbi:MazG nucleotide pyrophosphohydrolase domain-containing protein [Rothia nasimurium]|uniref:MazG nucleotide pyrophosphohydrolase domain-containing protein n=1 Tax=Rothia nasimurium TaxID=85336 RepID=UPI001F161A46|nr:MazG nucleotide pyrophosphohydrolase domain-containing protein [Rothia nasimurium]